MTLKDAHTEEETVLEFDRWMARDQDDFDVVRELPVAQDGAEPLPGMVTFFLGFERIAGYIFAVS